MPDYGLANSQSAACFTAEHAALSRPQQQRLSRLRKRHREIAPLENGPGGTLEATVTLTKYTQHIFLEDPDELLDRIEEVIGADQDGL
jgi:hypothetical protein